MLPPLSNDHGVIKRPILWRSPVAPTVSPSSRPAMTREEVRTTAAAGATSTVFE